MLDSLLASHKQGGSQLQLGDSHGPGLAPVGISVHLQGGEGGRAGAHNGHVVPYQKDAQALSQVAHDHALLPVHVPDELPAWRVERNGNELRDLGLAPLGVLPGLEVVSVLHCVGPVSGTPSDQGGLERVGAG